MSDDGGLDNNLGVGVGGSLCIVLRSRLAIVLTPRHSLARYGRWYFDGFLLNFGVMVDTFFSRSSFFLRRVLW